MTAQPAEGSAVLSVGTINMDVALRVDARLEQGVTLVARQMLRAPGGRAANVAVMARRLGVPARLFGCVGMDDLGEQALAGPLAAGVDVSGVRRVRTDTGFATIVVGDRGAKTMIFVPGANDGWSDADAERVAHAVLAAPDGSVLVADTELRPATLTRMLEAAREAGRSTVVDPSRPAHADDRLLALADHLTPSADEAAQMTGIPIASPGDARKAARRLRDRGACNVHVRLRHGGCLTLLQEHEMLIHAPPDVAVVDTSGGGDAFAGALASAMAAGQDQVDAVRFAVAAAACAVTRLGSQDACPDRRRLEDMLRATRVDHRSTTNPTTL